MSVLTLEEKFARLQFSDKQRLGFYRKLSKMLTQGVPLVKAVEDYHVRTVLSAGKKSPLAVMLKNWTLELRNGQGMGKTMEGWVPDAERMIIVASENAGKLEKGLLSACTLSIASGQIRKAITGGLAYPVAVLAMTFGYVYLFGAKVIPEFSLIMDPTKWQGLAYSLYVMSDFVQTKFVYLLACMLLLVVLIFVSLPFWRGRVRVWFDDIPPYSIYRMLRGSGFLTAFSALVGAGVTIEKAIERLRVGASPWLAERLDAALEGVKSGSSFGIALRDAGHNFPTKDLIDDMIVYSSYSGFDKALETLVQEWMTDGVERVTALMKLVNTFAILTLALVVVWLVGGFFGIQAELATMAQKGGI